LSNLPVIKSVYSKFLNTQVKFGCRRVQHPCQFLRLSRYLNLKLPTPPTSLDYSSAALSALRNIYLNSTLGDCVIANLGHVEGVLTGNAGSLYTFTDSQITALYSAIGGYVPGDPATDQGCDPVTMLNYWQSNGAPSGQHQIAGWLSVDPTNPMEIKTALDLFENVQFAMELPDAWVNPTPNGDGFVWDVAGSPDPSNGHMVCGYGYTPSGVLIDTWGMFGTLTFASIAEYCSAQANGSVYCIVSHDSLIAASQETPVGLNWSSLIADFDAIGGNVPLPGPTPPPFPVNQTTTTTAPPPSPFPPSPPPVPITTIIQQVNALFSMLEVRFAFFPEMVTVLKKVQAQVDAILSQYSMRVGTTQFRGVPPTIIAVIDAAFTAAAAQYPQWSSLILMARAAVDQLLPLL